MIIIIIINFLIIIIILLRTSCYKRKYMYEDGHLIYICNYRLLPIIIIIMIIIIIIIIIIIGDFASLWDHRVYEKEERTRYSSRLCLLKCGYC